MSRDDLLTNCDLKDKYIDLLNKSLSLEKIIAPWKKS